MALPTMPQRGWYYGWNIVVVCVLAGICANALPINAFSLFLADWGGVLHVPISTLMRGIMGCGIGCAVLSPVVGILADRYPAKRLFGVGLAGMALFCLGISYLEATWQFLALYAALLPISLLLSTSILANAVVSRWFVRRLGLALSLTSIGLSMAGIVMPPIVAHALPELGWRGIWRVGAFIIAVVILPLVLFVLRERPSAEDGLYYLNSDGSSGAVSHTLAAAGSPGIPWREILARRSFWLLVAIYVPMLALYGGVGQNIAPLASNRGLSLQTAGVLISLLSASQMVATLIVGVLSDRFGNRLPFSGLAFATALGGVLVVIAGGSVVVLGLGVMLAGCGGAFWPLIATTAAAQFGAGAVGRVFGLVTFFLPLTVTAPVIVAMTQESTGSYTPALLVISGLTALGGAAFLILLHDGRPPNKPVVAVAVPGSAAQSV